MGEQSSCIITDIGRFPFGSGKRKTLFKGSKVITHLQNDFPVYNALDMPPPPPRFSLMPIKYYKMRQNTRKQKKKQREQEKRSGKTFLRFDIWSMAFYVAHQRTNGCSTRIINFFPCAHYNTARRNEGNSFMMFLRCALIAIRV